VGQKVPGPRIAVEPPARTGPAGAGSASTDQQQQAFVPQALNKEQFAIDFLLHHASAAPGAQGQVTYLTNITNTSGIQFTTEL
jgi:hypothetical protein